MPNIDIEPEVLETLAAARPVNKGGLYYLGRLALQVAIYAAVGAFAHVQFYRRDFDQGDLLSWAWLGAWPLGLVVISLKWIGIILGVIVLLCLLGLAVFFAWRFVDNLIWARRLKKKARAAERGEPA